MLGVDVGGTVEGGTIVGGTLEGGTLEGGTVVGGTVVIVGGSVEGVGVGAVMVVMMIGGGDSTPCIWTGERERWGRKRAGLVRIIGSRTVVP